MKLFHHRFWQGFHLVHKECSIFVLLWHRAEIMFGKIASVATK